MPDRVVEADPKGAVRRVVVRVREPDRDEVPAAEMGNGEPHRSGLLMKAEAAPILAATKSRVGTPFESC